MVDNVNRKGLGERSFSTKMEGRRTEDRPRLKKWNTEKPHTSHSAHALGTGKEEESQPSTSTRREVTPGVMMKIHLVYCHSGHTCREPEGEEAEERKKRWDRCGIGDYNITRNTATGKRKKTSGIKNR